MQKFASLTYVLVKKWKLSCLGSAGRFSRHANLKHLFKQTLASVRVPPVLEPAHLYRTDNKRPDGMTLVPWKQLLWEVTVADALAPSRLSGGLVGEPGIVAVEAEERKNDK